MGPMGNQGLGPRRERGPGGGGMAEQVNPKLTPSGGALPPRALRAEVPSREAEARSWGRRP
jgi:hypothetical protein